MQSSSDKYIYIEELKYLKKLLHMKFGSNIEIVSESYSENHVSQPANVELIYLPRNLKIQVFFDSRRVNAVIKEGESEIALHRYLLNQDKYNQEMFKLDGKIENIIILHNLVTELEKTLKDSNLYFYVWEGEKCYRVQGGVKKRLKNGEF